jgi:hypothetical protein
MKRLRKLIPERFPRVRQWVERHGTFVAFLLVASASIWSIWTVRAQADDNRKAVKLALRALCDQKHSYEDQLKSTVQFLFLHPEGVPSLGFTKAEIQNSIRTLKDRVATYDDLSCPPTIPPKENK